MPDAERRAELERCFDAFERAQPLLGSAQTQGGAGGPGRAGWNQRAAGGKGGSASWLYKG